MKHTIALLSALVPAVLGAQELNVTKVMPPTGGDRLLTMEEVTTGRGVTPRISRKLPPEMKAARTPEKNGPAVYGRDGGVYYMDADSVERAIAVSDNPEISYGTTVSRNEFGIDGGLFPSPLGTKVAFYRKDESRVTDFPLLDIATRTGELLSIKYPMNGMDSELIDLEIHDFATGRTVRVGVDEFTPERFLTNISWSPDDRYVFIQVLDRTQHHMKLNMYRAGDGAFVRTLLTEDNDAWVEPYAPLHFLKGKYEFIYSTDNRDGYKNLYLCDTLGTVRRLTQVDADVEYVADNGSSVFYTSAEVAPVERHLFRIDIGRRGRIGKPVRLTTESGWHRVVLDGDCKYFVDSWSNLTTPGVYQLKSSDGKLVRVLSEAANPLAEYKIGEIRTGTVKSADGAWDNAFMMALPPDFDPSKKYPVIVYVYGGPHSQLITDKWLGGATLWDLSMAQKGYIVYTQDNRGTLNRGAAYEKAINRQCGQAEMADQMVGVNALKALPYVDSGRIGVDGWSYGGFMTISLLTNYPETFKVAVAGGPVIDWKWYEIMYGERYMDTMETNPEGFAKTSLITKAADVKGKLLILQGAVDDTVVWEHSLSFVQECVEKGVQIEYFPYPRSQHNVKGPWRVHLNTKITDYFINNL